MNRIAQFEKVSYEEFKRTWLNCFSCTEDVGDEEIRNIYESIKLPERSTSGSAGYDFISYMHFTLYPRCTITIPTGIRVKIEDGWCLACVPRSGHGFKYRIQLDNTIGIIDSDYYYSDNEGHIIIKLTNDSKKYGIKGRDLIVEPGTKYVQGIFLPYGITYDDNATNTRNGGMGSTDKK